MNFIFKISCICRHKIYVLGCPRKHEEESGKCCSLSILCIHTQEHHKKKLSKIVCLYFSNNKNYKIISFTRNIQTFKIPCHFSSLELDMRGSTNSITVDHYSVFFFYFTLFFSHQCISQRAVRTRFSKETYSLVIL